MPVPSIHFLGRQDDLYSNGLALAKQYKDPLVMEFDMGHKFPRLEGAELGVFLAKVEREMREEHLSARL